MKKIEDYYNIINKDETSTSIILRVEPKEKRGFCPNCNSSNITRRGKRVRTFKDIPCIKTNKTVTLCIDIQDYLCKECHKNFFDYLEFIEKNKSYTNRVESYVHLQIFNKVPAKSIAEKLNISIETVRKIKRTMLIN